MVYMERTMVYMNKSVLYKEDWFIWKGMVVYKERIMVYMNKSVLYKGQWSPEWTEHPGRFSPSESGDGWHGKGDDVTESGMQSWKEWME